MATKNTTGTTGAEAAALPTAKPEPLFKPFSWTGDGPHVLDKLPAVRVLACASTVRDLANGTALVLEMIESDLIEAASYAYGDDEAVHPPLLSEQHRSALMRMAIAANKMVAREVGALTDWAQEAAR